LKVRVILMMRSPVFREALKVTIRVILLISLLFYTSLKVYNYNTLFFKNVFFYITKKFKQIDSGIVASIIIWFFIALCGFNIIKYIYRAINHIMIRKNREKIIKASREKIAQGSKNMAHLVDNSFQLGKFTVHLVHKWFQWKKWKKIHQKSISCQELYMVVNTFYYVSPIVNIIRYIKKHRLLIAAKETKNSLRKLALEVEVYLQSGEVNNLTFPVSEQQINSECPILVKGADYEALDEIYLLLEDIRASLDGEVINV